MTPQPSGRSAWLWTITANKLRDFYRRNQKHVTAQSGSTALGSLEQVAVMPMRNRRMIANG